MQRRLPWRTDDALDGRAAQDVLLSLAKDPGRTFVLLRTWAGDANAHVRRLVSEGTRLRLPWASRVAWLDANPERVLGDTPHVAKERLRVARAP